jgi:hypothetical protein
LMQMFYLIVFLGLIKVRLLIIIKTIIAPMSAEQQERTAEGMLINFMMKSFIEASTGNCPLKSLRTFEVCSKLPAITRTFKSPFRFSIGLSNCNEPSSAIEITTW